MNDNYKNLLDEVGYVRIPSVFSKGQIWELAGYFEEMRVQSLAFQGTTKIGYTEFRFAEIEGKRTLKFVKWSADIHRGLNQFRVHDKLLSILFPILGPDLKQVTNQMHWKNPGDGVSFQFHQDCTFRKPDRSYRNLPISFLQTAIAVDPSTEENGALQVIPGSQRGAKVLLEGGYEPWEKNSVNKMKLKKMPKPKTIQMSPGDLLVWGPFLIHGSAPNRSSTSRRLYINGFARASDCDNGVLTTVSGQAVPLKIDSRVKWDTVEEH